MHNWIDNAYADIERDYNNGYLTVDEYRQAIKDLNSEVKEYEPEYFGGYD